MPDTTLPSGSSTKPLMSESSLAPNCGLKQRAIFTEATEQYPCCIIRVHRHAFPSAPCSFRPVKVVAIFQNLGRKSLAPWYHH